jgi:hypothetical protein
MEYQYLKELPTRDLVALLGEYVHTPALVEADKQFIREIQDELKTRKDVGVEK